MDNIKIKDLKYCIYSNKKLASKIQQYIIKYIENLDKIIVNLKQAEITIDEVKSQFY